MSIKYISTTKEWRDKINGNSYFSCQVEDIERDITYKFPFQYGYGSQSEFVIEQALGIKHELGKPRIIEHEKISKCKKRDVKSFGKDAKENFISDLGYYYCD
tara:strand:- start:67 stop:372 length:306 start_codon:yes stop_codon:yes gene_type:complete